MTTNETLTKIETMEKELKQLKEEVLKKDEKKVVTRGRAAEHETYYYITSGAEIDDDDEALSWADDARFALGNYYLTIAEAELALEQQKVTQMLRDIALELNNGVEIDYTDYSQDRYFIYYNYCDETLKTHVNFLTQMRQVYCLSEDFLRVAIERIGEDRLVNYFENYR